MNKTTQCFMVLFCLFASYLSAHASSERPSITTPSKDVIYQRLTNGASSEEKNIIEHSFAAYFANKTLSNNKFQEEFDTWIQSIVTPYSRKYCSGRANHLKRTLNNSCDYFLNALTCSNT